MSSNQDWYICMQVKDAAYAAQPELLELFGVNISKLVCENSRPQLERLHKSEAAPNKESTLFKNSVTNTVHQLELPAGRYDFVSLVITIDTKLYVLVRSSVDISFNGRQRIISQVVFQVYDPFHNLWKILPPPPFSDTHPKYSYAYFEWGHMLGVFDHRWEGPSYVFDTIEEKWMPAVVLPHLVCAVEFLGFLIGVPYDTHYRSRLSIVAYKLDENGLPDSNSKHTLDDDLWELFYPPLTSNNVNDNPFLYRFGDDHVLFLSTIEPNNNRLVLVAVFRVSISTVGGLPVVSAVFEHKQVYDLDNKSSYISSTFLMRNAPSYGTHISNMSPILYQPLQDDDYLGYMQDDDDDYGYMQDDDDYGYMQADDDDHAPPLDEAIHEQEDDDYGYMQDDDDHAPQLDEAIHEQDDDIAPPSKTETLELEKKIREDVEWDDQLKEKTMYMCFVENRTDSSVSYIIKAIKFSDLMSTSSHDSNSKLHQVASTSACHLDCLPCCGVFGSIILFAGGGENYQGEVAQQVPSSRDIYFYDVTSNDPMSYSNIKRFTKPFKGMKPQPVLAEVEGKLYALASSPKPKYLNPGPFFEIFDPVEKEWSPLPDPPTYTKFTSYSNYHAIAGSNLLAWGNESHGVFRFDMAADSVDKDWRLINNSRVFDDEGIRQSTIVVDSDVNGGGDFVLFTYKNHYWCSADLQVHLISHKFDYVVCLPSLKLPESVSSFLKTHETDHYSSFVDLGGRRVCLAVSCPFYGPYSRNVHQLGEVDKMGIVILVFEFEVTKNRKSVAAEFVFHRMLEYYDTNSDPIRNPMTSDTHMVGAFLL